MDLGQCTCWLKRQQDVGVPARISRQIPALIWPLSLFILVIILLIYASLTFYTELFISRDNFVISCLVFLRGHAPALHVDVSWWHLHVPILYLLLRVAPISYNQIRRLIFEIIFRLLLGICLGHISKLKKHEI